MKKSRETNANILKRMHSIFLLFQYHPKAMDKHSNLLKETLIKTFPSRNRQARSSFPMPFSGVKRVPPAHNALPEVANEKMN